MNSQDSVQLIMMGLGEKELHELTQEESKIVQIVIDSINDNPCKAKILYDYIRDKKENVVSEHNIYGNIVSACERMNMEIDDEIFILQANEDDWKSFEVLDMPSSNNCAKANIYIQNEGEEEWCHGEGITSDQRLFLNSHNIKYIKWCVPINGEYVPVTSNYKKVSLIPTTDSKHKKESGKEAAMLGVSLATLLALTIGNSYNNF